MLPLATTTITVERPADGDPYEAAASTATASTGTPAHIGSPSGSEIDRGGQLERIDTVLLAEAGLDLTHTDLVVDEATGQRYRVGWVDHRRGLGLDHTKAGLARYSGGANGG